LLPQEILDRSWDFIFNSVLLAVPAFWAIGWFYMKIMKRQVSLCCLLVKKDKGTALQVILYTVWLLIFSLPTLGYTGNCLYRQ
jgi:hypothetical protein